MNKKYPIRQKIKALPDRKPNRLTFNPPAKHGDFFSPLWKVQALKRRWPGDGIYSLY